MHTVGLQFINQHTSSVDKKHLITLQSQHCVCPCLNLGNFMSSSMWFG